VSQRTKESARTISRRLADLVDRGLLERRGATSTAAYRSTGLI
jgi:predicted HTH transcriptional regulator